MDSEKSDFLKSDDGQGKFSGKYIVDIIHEDDYYIAKIERDGRHLAYTQGAGEDPQNIFYMIGDCLATYYDIMIPWWKKVLIRLFNL